MAELWGDDDYLYGDYLKWKRLVPCGLWVLLFIAILSVGLPILNLALRTGR